MKLSKQDIIDAGVTFIGLKGPAGSGKTTATKVMRQHFQDALVLPGSHYHYKATVEDGKLSKSVFGRTFNSESEALQYYLENESAELLVSWITKSLPCINDMYKGDIKKLLSQNFIPNPIIADWAFANALEDVWGLTTNKLGVSATQEVIARNQGIREGKDTSSIRSAMAFLYGVGEPADMIIENLISDDLTDYNDKVKKYCDSIIVNDSSKIF